MAPAVVPLFQAPQFMEPVSVEAPARTKGKITDVSGSKESGPKAPKNEPKREKRSNKNSSSKTVAKTRGRKRTDENASEDDSRILDTDSVLTESDSNETSTKRRTKNSPKTSKGRTKKTDDVEEPSEQVSESVPAENTIAEEVDGTHRRRRRRRSRSNDSDASDSSESNTDDQVKALKGSTRLEAKRMRRREGRKEGRRRQSITEAEFLARRESVSREMIVRHKDGLDQIAVLEDGLLVEHYVARKTQQSIVGNIYLGRVQNVLPSMEAAFVDIGRGRNAVLYAGEVNWDSLGMEGKPRRIETALKSGDTVLVQVTKDPIGHKGARLTSQITLAGRYLVLVPGSAMLGISRKLPDIERQRLKKILREVVPENTGVIVRTAAEGASEEQLRDDVLRLDKQWKEVQRKERGTKKAPQLLRGEPELVVRVVRDIFNEDFNELLVQGEETWQTVQDYVSELSPELSARIEKWTGEEDVFHAKRVDQQLAKGMDRKVWLPSGGTLVIDRTEALSVIDVNTGKFIGSGGTLEETVTRNNLEAAEEIVRQLRLRDIGGIIIIDFVDMVLESNRELVLRRLIECLGRDRTRHQVTEITSLGLVQMTRKRVGEGLVEAFSTTCETCEGRGFVVHDHPVEIAISTSAPSQNRERRGKERPSKAANMHLAEDKGSVDESSVSHVGEEKVKTALSAIAAATIPGEKPQQQSNASKNSVKTEGTMAENQATEGPTKPAVRKRRVATTSVVDPGVSEKGSSNTSSGTAANTGEDVAAATINADTDKPVHSVTEIALPEKVVDSAEPKAKRSRRKVTSEDVDNKATKKDSSKSRSRSRKTVDSDKAQSAKEAVQNLFKS